MTTIQPQHQDWTVAWVAFVVALFAWGAGFYGPAMFVHALHASRGWSISLVGMAVTTHFLLSAVLVANLPRVHHRLGVTHATLGGTGLLAVGIVAWAASPEAWLLFPAAALTAAGWAATSGAAIHALVAPRYGRTLPKALAIAFNGASAGGVLIAPLWAFLIAQTGLLAAALVIGVGMVLIVIPLVWRFLYRRDTNARLLQPLASTAPTPLDQPVSTLRLALLRDPRFVSISVAFAMGLFAQIGIFIHLVSHLATTLGIAGASGAISLVTLCAVGGRTMLGWWVGSGSLRNLAAVNFIMQSVGVVMLAFAPWPALVISGCILFGLGVGNLITLPPLIAHRDLPAAHVGTAVALVTSINQAVFAFAPAMVGIARDYFGDYSVAFALAAGLQLCAAMVVRRHR